MPPQYFGALDLIRLASAAAVMWFHLAYWSWIAGTTANQASLGSASFPELSLTSSWGWVGVQIFFVISGFVIAQSAHQKTATAFAVSRFRRLIPGMLICATITASVAFAIGLWPLDDIIRRYVSTLIFSTTGPWIDGVYWTLTIEIIFYAAVWLLLIFGLSEHLETFGLVLGTASAAYLIAQKVSVVGFIDPHYLLQHGCYFAIGIMFWVIVTAGNSPLRMVATTIFIISGCFEISMYGPVAKSIATPVWIIALVAIGASSHMKFKTTALTRRLGLMTYPLYLIHAVVGGAVLRLAPYIGKYAALATALIAVMLLAWIVVDLERYLRRIFDRVLSPQRERLIALD